MSSGKLFSSSVSSVGTRTNNAASAAAAVLSSTGGFYDVSSFGAGATADIGPAINVLSSSFSSTVASGQTQAAGNVAASNSISAGSGFIPPPSVFPVLNYSTPHWELHVGLASSCVGYRNRTLMLSAISATLYEAAYTGCRFRDTSASVLSVRSNLTTASEQKKELSNARSKLGKGGQGVTSLNLVSLADTSSSKKGLSGGAIAGIVIGVVVFVLILAGVGYYVFMWQASDDATDYTAMKDEPKGSAAAPAKR